MKEYKLEDSIEYQQIREKRNIIKNILNPSTASANAAPANLISNAIFTIINHLPKEFFIINPEGPDKAKPAAGAGNAIDAKNNARPEVNNDAKAALFSLITKSDMLSSYAAEVNLKAARNIQSIYSISNYAFAEYVFTFECENNDEYKRFRSGPAFDESATVISRHARRKAEELYKNNQLDDALKYFKESEEKNPLDFTTQYQMGLIYFFDKASYVDAMYYFGKACKNSQNKMNPIFIHSMVFMGLILRLIADSSANHDMYNESYQALAQAYSVDTACNFSKYALAQCCFRVTARSDAPQQALKLLYELIHSEKLYALQMIYDHAFDRVNNELSMMLNNMGNECRSAISEIFEKIGISLDALARYSKYLTVPARVTAITAEYKKIFETVSKNKEYFIILEVTEKARMMSAELQELIAAAEKNKKYFEIKECVESLISKYNSELAEAVAPFVKVQEKYNGVREQLQKLNDTYPVAVEEHYEEKTVMSGGVQKIEREFVPARTGWRDTGLFTLIKWISSSFIFLSITFFIIMISLFITNVGMIFLVVGVIVNLLMTPLYGTICGEIYFNIIEAKRKNLETGSEKLRYQLNVNKVRIDEMDKGIRDKYVKSLATSMQFLPFTAEKMFEAGLEGSFEKIKNLMQQ